MQIFPKDNIYLAQVCQSKNEAITLAGQILVRNHYVVNAYVEDMLLREANVSTYIGNNVAIPHGLVTSEDKILALGISLVQVPAGVEFDGERVYLVFGIAGKNNEHLAILGKIAQVCSDLRNIELLSHTQSKDEILTLFQEVI